MSTAPPIEFFPPAVLYPGVGLVVIGGLGVTFGGGLMVSLARSGAIKNGGDIDDPKSRLHRLNRAHGNATEYYPSLALLLVLLSTVPGSSEAKTALLALSLTVLALRTLHYIGMVTPFYPCRVLGAVGTVLVGLVLSVWGIVGPVIDLNARLIAAILSLVFLEALFVLLARVKVIGRNDEGKNELDTTLYKWQRIHLNHTEYAPIFCCCVYVLNTLSRDASTAFACIFLAARLLHAYGMIMAPPVAEGKPHIARVFGASLTYLSGLAATIGALVAAGSHYDVLAVLLVGIFSLLIFVLGILVSRGRRIDAARRLAARKDDDAAAAYIAMDEDGDGTAAAEEKPVEERATALYSARRAHGNATEFLPMLAVTIVFAAVNLKAPIGLVIVFYINLLGRLVYSYGASCGPPMTQVSKARLVGALTNYLTGLIIFFWMIPFIYIVE